MADRHSLLEWVPEALEALGGKAKIVDVARQIWKTHSSELQDADPLFYTWQYDMRWAALKLRQQSKLASLDDLPRGVWALPVEGED